MAQAPVVKKPTDWPAALSRPGPTLFIRGQSLLSTAGWWKESPPTLVNDGNCRWRAAPTAYDGGLTTPSPKGPLMKLPDIVFPTKFKIDGLTFEVASYHQLTHQQAANVAMHCFQSKNWAKAARSRTHRLLWAGDEATTALLPQVQLPAPKAK
jgi:hypothetical protein